jgi:excisionase family DNA binding protein
MTRQGEASQPVSSVEGVVTTMRQTEIFWKPWQAADYLRIPVEALYKLIERQEIAADQREGTWYIRKSVLDAWLDKPATDAELEELQRLIDATRPAEQGDSAPAG